MLARLGEDSVTIDGRCPCCKELLSTLILGTLHQASAHAAPSRRLGIVHLGGSPGDIGLVIGQRSRPGRRGSGDGSLPTALSEVGRGSVVADQRCLVTRL
jgi:hypothetical protein